MKISPATARREICPPVPPRATILPNLKSKYQTTSASQLNTLDGALGGTKIYLSPENYFFANDTTLYIADSGNPKGDNNGAGGTPQGLGDGRPAEMGVQRRKLESDRHAVGGTGAGSGHDAVSAEPDRLRHHRPDWTDRRVVGDTVELFATNRTLGDEDPTYLYGITDLISSTTSVGESFTILATAAPGTNIRGVAFAPVPEPATWGTLLSALGVLAFVRRRQVKAAPSGALTRADIFSHLWFRHLVPTWVRR